MELKIYTDGGSINNPGPAAISFLVYKNSKPLKQFSTKIGINTNNFAEYKALMSAMEWVRENIKEDYSKIIVFSDSNLMVNQLNGLYKVKNTVIRDFIIKIRVLEQEINKPVFYQYIPREKNWLADSLVKKALQNF
ncbi:hypothetical protein A3C98_00730 [Candidatus Roizmanbacteria bacterium RIFCSPHIGHO2_02_FULL_37_15]|uniref:RNase H type-1 domain-containing protein n=1 Tax=Candidatus Roizmanbacteria bacterium RIFCSPLOWO2_01_FULL_37_16 TaxID=1802058 RepID=A0A1F7INV6_9BACT|nr:MAG: hypothetical protein A2859_03720 [Candidatus Roizmanbacteria bacterium RIFCSPHIGHO2_01_FULL_37_16b]OGK21349.1 MAG: hypothetical protein A3C98_00730 [Candidatus Roizmanbacteria bacterium RIFCSPHIGHO2_02_FULL_37_15]OGK32280.1 MAG: hypothetical protein A3F57_03850 [Candidatus Roizmanbacteria bacterium RIFCSPHIGHO2_12_FULL_36_11]OGK45039.1 MAG: hypothetical protein A3B40_01335 [Candidatus Roizmanbacteria bacterium RIFCSPLOWO2_01_FULL_37_16]OGK57423.1 MAG: hypothetical protein A3I50_05465 [C